MSCLEALGAAVAGTVDLLDEASGLPKRAILARVKSPKLATSLHKLAKIYTGRTNNPKKQAAARENITAQGHTFDTLEIVERYAKKLVNKRRMWEVRETLTRLPADDRLLTAEAKKLVARLNGKRVDTPDKIVSARDVKNSTLMDLHVRGTGYKMEMVMERVRQYSADNNVHPADAIQDLILGADAGGSAQITPMVVLTLDENVIGKTKEARNQYTFSLTNGSTITGLELAQADLTDKGYAILLDPFDGTTLGLYQFDTPNPHARFADPLDRFIQKVKNPVCAWPDCGTGAEYSQVHHVHSYKDGGPSTEENFSVLCKFDNGRNDDDRTKPKHGHMEKIDGLDYWVPAFGGEKLLNMHPCAQGGAVRVAKRMWNANNPDRRIAF